MEGRFLFLFLSGALLLANMTGCAGRKARKAARSDDSAVELPSQVIEPDVERRDLKVPKIDTERFEVGAQVGFMSVEDFGTNATIGARFSYHINERFFIEATYGQTDTDETSFELLSGAAQLLTDEQREYTYYNASFGYNVLPGEVFVGKKRAFTTSLYLIGGVGSTDFAGDERFTVNFGAGFRLLANDWLAVHLEVRDHAFDIDLFGQEKTAHNLETLLGVTWFF